MAKKKETKEAEGSILVDAAKAIGSTAGKIASLAEAVVVGPKTPKTPKASGKLPKKNKSRLPRRQKKALQRKARKNAL